MMGAILGHVKTLAVVGVLGLGLTAATQSASAHTNVSLGFNFGIPLFASQPVYAAPQPVYAVPQPIYAAPVYAAPVYAAPVCPAPVYAAPVYAPVCAPAPVIVYGHGYSNHHDYHTWDHHGWDHH